MMAREARNALPLNDRPAYKAVLTVSAIVSGLFAAAPAWGQELPQTQIAAAAVVLRQVVFAGWDDWQRGGRIDLIDDTKATIYGYAIGQGQASSPATVRKLDECRFEAVRPGSETRLASIDLGVLSDEYTQGQNFRSPGGFARSVPNQYVTVIGTGKGAAVCGAFGCFKDLTLGMGGSNAAPYPDSAWRALRAVTFLQQYCPPQRLGF